MFNRILFLFFAVVVIGVSDGFCGDKPFMEVISVEPNSPGVLEPGQPVYVTFRYDGAGAENIQTWVHPVKGNTGCKSHPCRVLKKNSGRLMGWFYFDDNAAYVKGIRLSMSETRKGQKRQKIFEKSFPVDLRWRAPKANEPDGYTAPGTSVKLGTVRPEMPAVLKVGEKFLARFQYNSGGSKSINISILPGKQKDGKAPPQDKSQINNRKGHSSQDQIYFAYDQPGSVSEMKFRMIDNETGRFLVQYTFPVDVTWVEGGSGDQKDPAGDDSKTEDNEAKAETVTIRFRGKITSTKVPGYINVGDKFQVVAVIDCSKRDKSDYYKESLKYHKGFTDGAVFWELTLLEGSTGSYKGAKVTKASKQFSTVVSFDYLPGQRDQLSVSADPATVVSDKLGESTFYSCGVRIWDKTGLSLNDTGKGQTLAELTRDFKIVKDWTAENGGDFDFNIRTNGKGGEGANGVVESVVIVGGSAEEMKEEAAVDSQRKLFDSIFALARRHYDVRNYEEARKLFGYLWENSPYNEHVFRAGRRLFAIELFQGNDAAAKEAFEALWAKRCGEEAFIDAVMGVCHPYIYGIKKKNYQWAVEVIDKLINELPGHELTIRILKNKAEAYLSGKQWYKADAVIDKIVRDYPKHKELGATLNEIAFNCLERKDRERCERLYKLMLQLDCDETSNVLAHSGVAMCAVWKKDDALVDEKIKLLLEKYKGNEKLSFSIFVIGMEYTYIAQTGSSQDKQEYYKKALKAFNHCIYDIEHDKQAAYACYYSAYIYKFMNDYKKAIKYYGMVIEKYPGYRSAWNAQHQITLGLDRLYRNKEMTLEEVKPLILESCEKFRKNYPDCKISGAWKKYYDKYINLHD